MADKPSEQDPIEAKREREMNSPDVTQQDENAFDEAFSRVGTEQETAEQETAEQAPSQQTLELGEDDTTQAASQETSQETQETQEASQETQGETWDAVGREIGALFEKDSDNITPDRVKHHVKTWHGRYKAERDKRIEAEQALEQARTQASSASEGGSDKDSASGDELRRRFSEEYGEDLPQLVEQLVETRAREIAQEQTTQAIQPIQERQQQADNDEHQRQVTERHPDAGELADSDDLWQWIDSQPPAFRDAYNRIAENGSAEDVNAMLDTYKQARGMGGSSTPEGQSNAEETTGAQQSQGGESQKGQPGQRRAPQRPASRSVGGPRRGDADPNDFDSAFDEALRA